MLDYEELLALASKSRGGVTGDNSRTGGGRRRSSILSSLKQKARNSCPRWATGEELLKCAAGFAIRQHCGHGGAIGTRGPLRK